MNDLHMLISEPELIDITMEDSSEISMSASDEHYQTNNYEKLKNLPKLNGETIIGDMGEIDPTVPDWAKEEKPTEMDFSEIKEIWDSIFKEDK